MINSKICFILYKPAVPGNIGASARAIKTMGFSELRLIDPADHLSDEAKMMAHASHDILESCKIYTSFEEAVSDIDFVICTTAKEKSAKVDYIDSTNLTGFLKEKLALTQKIALVFGSEESGLPNSILLKANAAVTIPMTAAYPSLNLSQAVMIIAYELSQLRKIAKEEKQLEQDEKSWKELQERTEVILEKIDIKSSTPLFHRIIERMSFLKASDARLLHSISSKIVARFIDKK